MIINDFDFFYYSKNKNTKFFILTELSYRSLGIIDFIKNNLCEKFIFIEDIESLNIQKIFNKNILIIFHLYDIEFNDIKKKISFIKYFTENNGYFIIILHSFKNNEKKIEKIFSQINNVIIKVEELNKESLCKWIYQFAFFHKFNITYYIVYYISKLIYKDLLLFILSFNRYKIFFIENNKFSLSSFILIANKKNCNMSNILRNLYSENFINTLYIYKSTDLKKKYTDFFHTILYSVNNKNYVNNINYDIIVFNLLIFDLSMKNNNVSVGWVFTFYIIIILFLRKKVLTNKDIYFDKFNIEYFTKM